jgi:hypothetical protein
MFQSQTQRNPLPTNSSFSFSKQKSSPTNITSSPTNSSFSFSIQKSSPTNITSSTSSKILSCYFPANDTNQKSQYHTQNSISFKNCYPNSNRNTNISNQTKFNEQNSIFIYNSISSNQQDIDHQTIWSLKPKSMTPLNKDKGDNFSESNKIQSFQDKTSNFNISNSLHSYFSEPIEKNSQAKSPEDEISELKK